MPDPVAPPTGVRLQKALADAGVGARRDCEAMIAAGRVKVNGRVVKTLPHFVQPERDLIEVDHEIVESRTPEQARRELPAKELKYVLLNKPKKVITTTKDDLGRADVLSLLPPALRGPQRLYPVGRLDGDSTGLLLLTNDGELAYRLTHPSFGVTKDYRVLVSGLADEEQLQALKRGLYLIHESPTGERTSKRATLESVRIAKRIVDRNRGDRTLLIITLREGQNREIRRLLARVGLKVRELERIAIGPLRNPGLKPGESKLLGKRDVERLRAATLDSPEPRKPRAKNAARRS
jgi:23S rRNA pseudouridine2605 synthase